MDPGFQIVESPVVPVFFYTEQWEQPTCLASLYLALLLSGIVSLAYFTKRNQAISV